ncbi:right-handed parallel beta-helix repeat-containing protein [Methanobrevibacter sp.]|uniref:right-handed parallel beta-helix repeat-containing protein n=1 Tax=Methanobrevibacter sp. TaxID=66852 RepID=UPI0025EC8D9A|nr:right-handed parallel beta-helix repeat-containing protein [Methanobrevibacter sp.]MBQ2961387.1 right-handed parallel beta-helix repeat-containing protein [Methanobrevibacter sp.]
MNKKIILSLLAVFIVAISLSAVSAADDVAVDDVITDAGIGEVVAVEEPAAADDAVLADGEEKTGDDIQTLIDNAEDGGEVDLGVDQVYNVADGKIFNITKKVTVKGTNVVIKASGASQGGSGALFIANVAGTGFDGITFINTDGKKTYGQQVSGYAIQLAIENGTVNNCKFLDWGSGVYGRGAAFCNITNSYFNGSSEKVTNGGTKEYGTKAINLMGSHDITVKDCTFEGQVLDGISIASNSGNNIMTDNTFIENCYAIYFGGASTQGCVIANNSFIRCGWCEDAEGNVIFKDLPVISTQKAANGYIIADNTIEATEGSIFMKAESGNTAHGYPSAIGDINITGNTLTVAEGANPATITFMYILSNQGQLSPYAPINISGNTIAEGVTPVTVWYADWGSETDPVFPAADPVATSIIIKDISTATKKVTIELVDVNGVAQAGKEISYSINGGATQTGETDADGLLTIDVAEDGVIALAFAGDEELKAAETSINFASTAVKTTPTITASAMTATAKIAKYYTITLKDSTGKALVGESVTFYFNGKTTTVKTDENGKAKLSINVATKGNYQIAVSYLGNDKNNAVTTAKNIKVNVQATKATFKKATLKVKKVKSVKFTLKDSKGKAIKGKKITIKVNGKTFSAKTNAKGVATIKVKVTKKGKFLATAKFAGDNTYKAITKKAYFTVK